MTDVQNLKVLAEASPAGPWINENDSLYFKDDGYTRHLLDADSGSDVEEGSYYAALKFIAAANPAAVLQLIADLERNQRMLLAACLDMGAIGEALGADMNSDGDELLGMISELKGKYQAARDRKNSITALKVENESLQSACAGALKFVAFAFDQGIEGAELAGRAIEAALSKATPPLNPA